MKSKRNPWYFIPSQYFAEGIPYVLVNQLTSALYKSLDASNSFIGLTSFLYIPWSIKFLWSPFVDSYKTKRWWVISMQLLLGICFIAIAGVMGLSEYQTLTLIIFTIIAFISATHDIATDGFYLHALDGGQQAFFTGIRSTFYRFAMIMGSGILVSLAGEIGKSSSSVSLGWSVAFMVSAAIFIILFIYHKIILPYPVSDRPVMEAGENIPYKIIFKEYFSQKKIGIILAFILLYRFGEGMILKMAQPFFLDSLDKGGLNLSLQEVGIMYGTIGVIALIFGGILGGWLVKKHGLKKLIFPLAMCMNLPNLLFVYLAAFQPLIIWKIDISFLGLFLDFHPVVQTSIILEQFGYGLGFTSFMVYLLYISKGPYKTSLYAISTGIMAIGMMAPGIVSGYLQEWAGYFGLFAIGLICTIPGMLIIFLLPQEEKEEKR